MAKARLIYRSFDGVELIHIDTHRIEFSGKQEAGYCYIHQTFDCLETLTEEQWEAIHGPLEAEGYDDDGS